MSQGRKIRVEKTLLLHYQDFDYAITQYRAGKPIQECADEIGVTRARLFDHISKAGVTFDLGQAIRDRATDILAHDIVPANGRLPSTPDEVIQINATLQASIIRSHRGDIDRFRRLCMMFLDELEGMTQYRDVFEDLGERLRSEDRNGKDGLNEAYQKVISLPGRTETLKKLGETLKTLIGLERQAFGMRDDYEDDEIRKARLAPLGTDDPVEKDFGSITRKFMKYMGKADEVTDVPANQDQAQATVPASP